MKSLNSRFYVFIILLMIAPVNAQQINWYSMDAGGGKSNANDISIIGVIGQVDTAQMSDGEITISGGYLPLPADSELIFKNSFE